MENIEAFFRLALLIGVAVDIPLYRVILVGGRSVSLAARELEADEIGLGVVEEGGLQAKEEDVLGPDGLV